MSEQPLDINSLIEAALTEDLGPRGMMGDITSQLIIPEDKQGEIQFAAREDMVACGAFIPAAVYAQLDTQVKCVAKVAEGARVAPGTILAVARGPARALLAGERVALNLMQRACSVATLTAMYVEAVVGTKAVLLDTRKTMPGMRALDKYAVRAAGGQNHRRGLDDMVLIKDNHIAMCGSVEKAVKMARAGLDSSLAALSVIPADSISLSVIPADSISLSIIPADSVSLSVIPAKAGIHLSTEKKSMMDSCFRRNDEDGNDENGGIKIVVECDTLAQVAEALSAKPDRILLDNMSNDMLREAVAMAAGTMPLEASGGVSLETIRGIAETGVDFISVGRLTHSAPAVDIGADIALNASASDRGNS